MEIVIPLVALSGLYFVSKDRNRSTNTTEDEVDVNAYENFQTYGSLPNTDLPNKNYPEEYPINPTTQELDVTSKLSVTNKFDAPSVYTDKYFNQEIYKQTDGQTFKSMTGETVNSSYFEHNNMTPFFGTRNRSNILEADSTEGVLDAYTGSGTQIIRKTEQSPLFSPGENYQYAHGAPNQNDFYQSRVNPSMRMANMKPFESQQVGPGLGLGTESNAGSGGFNSGMEMREAWMPKTVDELRTTNNQRAGGIGLLGHEGPATHFTKTLGSIGKVEKNRVERAWEHSPDRYFTTTGVEKGPTLHAIPMLRDVSRPETTMSYTGVATSQNPSQAGVTGEYMESKHMDLGPIPIGIANAVGHSQAASTDYGGLQNTQTYSNNRTSTGDETYFGAFGGAIGAVVAPLLDELRPSRKQNAIGTMRPYQNAQSKVGSSYLFNPADRPAPTIRETTEKNNFVSGVNSNQRGGAYKVTEHQPVRNERDTTNVSYAGGSSAAAGAKAIRPYDAEYRQRNNDIKSSTIQGHMVKGSTSILNATVNQQNRNGEIANNRQTMMTLGPRQVAGTEFMGQAHARQEYNSAIQLDRNTPDILDAFRKNPYTHSLTNIA
jgi:hypothetical protein